MIDVVKGESALGEHWQVFCVCGYQTAYWMSVVHAVDEYGRHAIVAAFDSAVDTLTERHRRRNQPSDPPRGRSPFGRILARVVGG